MLSDRPVGRFCVRKKERKKERTKDRKKQKTKKKERKWVVTLATWGEVTPAAILTKFGP